VRFENLADRFDQTTKKTNFIDLQKFGNDLYKDVNGDVPEGLSIMEVTLQGNLDKNATEAKRFKWRGLDDGSILPYSKAPKDMANFMGIALEPQRIRTFKIDFKPAAIEVMEEIVNEKGEPVNEKGELIPIAPK